MKNQLQKKKDLIRINTDIKDELLIRITVLKLTYNAIEKDALLFNRVIRKSRLSQYFKQSTTQMAFTLSQEDVIWLCDRYGIEIKIRVKANRYHERTRKQYIKRKYGEGSKIHA